MARTLVVVESPAKAKTIGRYLGKDYMIAASVGHIRDLPTQSMGVDIASGFKPRYITMQGKQKIVKELKAKAELCDNVLLATDPDREGEAIAYHLAHILKIDPSSLCRVTFNEITEKVIKEAVKQPRSVDLSLVDAQQARRILDRLVGYELSPLLWEKIKKGLSAGRVQSVTSRMIVERERQVRGFVPEEYWTLRADLFSVLNLCEFSALYYGSMINDKVKKNGIHSESAMNELLGRIEGKPFSVWQIKEGSLTRQPSAPFTTSTLQQEASRVLGYQAVRTMRIAQQLYEGINLPKSGPTSLVTYIRTDSTRISPEAESEAKKWLKRYYGEEFVYEKTRKYGKKTNAQDAHEAIRPTHFDLPPQALEGALAPEQMKLYRLIWNRFMASNMMAAKYKTLQTDVVAANEVFRTKGETCVFKGFMILFGNKDLTDESDKDTSSKALTTELTIGETLELQKLEPKQEFTKPPARYTEATLIKAMEEQGIGRPSTYAPTISTLLARQYIDKEGRQLMPTKLGETVNELLEKNFEQIVDAKFTASMETELDQIEDGGIEYPKVLEKFYTPFHEQVLLAKQTLDKIKAPIKPTGELCPECGKELIIRESRYGEFIACSGFPECNFSKNIEVLSKAHCPKCGGSLLIKMTRKGRKRKFFVCKHDGNNSDCDFISWGEPVDGRVCEVCGAHMETATFRGKAYISCSNSACATKQKAKSKAAPKNKSKTKEKAE